MAENQLQDDIAIVGISCRFPGASNTQDFWDVISQGKECITWFDEQELLEAGLEESIVKRPSFIPASGYVENADWFDAEFFGFSRSEAEITDPQFRVFLECAWEALEDAGCVPNNFKGKIGAFVGSGMSLYASKDMKSYFSHNLLKSHDLIDSLEHPQIILGNNREYLPTRVSYKLNLKGPSLNIQTACSTSLVATHMACQSLRTGESDAVLVGASAFHAPLKSGYIYKEGTFFASDGHCRVFDENSEGIVGGNGAGVVILKRLGDAIAAKDNIHAIIKGSAINNDGNAKVSYTAPSFEGQVEVIERAQSLAGVSPESITYLEAHGTGTKMGDPIEVAALCEVFQRKVSKKQYCALGSVKANIGHLDTAAGMASLIKTVLCLKNGKIPPQINFTKENPSLKLQESPFYINQRLKDWESPDSPRTAGVSSFGAGGTNAHCILQEYQEHSDDDGLSEPDHHILTLSAKSPKALEDLTKRFQEWSVNEDISFANACYTSNCGRQHYAYRRSVVGTGFEDVREQLAGAPTEPNISQAPKVSFLFTGQGSQYVEMGKDLYNSNTFYREQLDKCFHILKDLLPESPWDILFDPMKGRELINNTRYSQPLLFALEYSLSQLWLSWGVKPKALMGHSLGEYVAACIAGAMSIEDGLFLVATRAHLMASLPEGGSMVSIATDRQTMASRLSGFSDVGIAAVNGPQSVVISGTKQSCNTIADQFEEEGVDVRPLRVSHAFHSHLMEPILDKFQEALSNINFTKPSLPIISNLTGDVITEKHLDAEYWVKHLRNAVEFEKGIHSLDQMGVNTYLEIGPKPMLVNLARFCLDEKPRLWLQSMAYKQNTWKQLLSTVQRLYDAGGSIHWDTLHGSFKGSKCSIPTYPFQRERFYINAPSPDFASTPVVSYEKIWEESSTVSDISPNTVVLIGQDDPFTSTLKNNLKSLGKHVHLISTDDCIPQLSKFAAASREKRISVVYTRAMSLEGLTPQNYLKVYQEVVNIAQIQLKLDLLIPNSLVIVTKNAIQTSNQDIQVNPLQTAFGSFVRSLNTEMGEPVSSIIDLENQLSPEDLDVLANLLSSSRTEEVCVRNGKALTHKLTTYDISKSSTEYQVPTYGAYLITGGLGSIGLSVAEWLAENQAKQIILMARSTPSAEVQVSIQNLREGGCDVHFVQGDVSEASGLKSLHELIKRNKLSLKGIFHAAGTLEDASLLSLTSEKMAKVMAPKVQGMLNLDSLVHEHNLDFIILCSSIASFLGSKGQINYAMANGFLDGYASHLRQSGIHAVSINWGPWGDGGMASQVESQLANYNLGRITKKQGLSLLSKCLQPETPAITPLIPLKTNESKMPFTALSELSKWIWNIGENTTDKGDTQCIQDSKVWTREDVSSTLQKVVKDIVGASAEDLTHEAIGFHDLGIDSIMALQLRERLATIFKLTLSATLIYKYPTLNELTNFLYGELQPEWETNETRLASLSEQLKNELRSLKA